MTIGSRLTAAFASVLVIIGAGAIITNWQFTGIASDAKRIIAVDNRLTSVHEVERDIGTLSRHISTMVEQRDEVRLLGETKSARNLLAQHLRAATAAFEESGLAPPPALASSVRSVDDELDSIERLAQIDDWQAIRLRINNQFDRILRELGDIVDQIATTAQQDREAAMRQVNMRQHRAQYILATTAILSLLASLLLGYYVTRSVTTPLLALKRAAHQLAERDFELKIQPDTNDELADVGRDLLVAGRNLQAFYSALERSNADLERFAHAVSHDLREPLRTISIFSQLLERQHAATLAPAASEQLSLIGSAALRMNELIDGILAYSRLTNSGGDQLEELNVTEVIETVLCNLQVMISESNAKIQVEPLPAIYANRIQIIQVFQNLISNAIKYQRKGVTPIIHIFAQEEKNRWVFCISDNGIGIRAEHHRRIFEPFQQIEPSRAAGVGLGLATTKRIVEQYGGYLWVESDGISGSKFFLSVPMRTAADHVTGLIPFVEKIDTLEK